MAKKNMTQAVNESMADKAQAEQLKAVERALFTLVKAGRTDLIDTAIVKSGLAISAEEHAAARPMTADEIAAAALAEIGIDIASLKADTATAGKLAVNKASLAQAFGSYAKHIDACDASNGTSLVSHFVAAAILADGKVDIGAIMQAVNKAYTRDGIYKNTNHFATLRGKLRKAGFNVMITKAGFNVLA